VWLWAQGPQPAFGVLTASPPNFVFDTPTTVTFTVQIETPTLNPTTVELQRVDAEGHLQTTVGPMEDKGQNGDLQAEDRVFTRQVLLNEPEIGRLYFRVTAAFRGNQQNAFSELTAVDVDPVPLPPDPGEAGKQTLEGIDSDNDGVRDDVQRYIAISQVSNELVREALTQLVRVNQDFIIYSQGDQNIVISIAERRHAASDCLNFVTGNPRITYTLGRELRAVLLNTEERSRAYVIADTQLSGVSFPVSDPEQWWESCE